MAYETDRPGGHVPGQLDLTGGPVTPATRGELLAQLEMLDVALLQSRTEAVDAVAKWSKAATDTDTALDRAVAEARGLGATWQQIADAAGITKQSAWKRWASPTDHVHELDAAGRCSLCGASS